VLARFERILGSMNGRLNDQLGMYDLRKEEAKGCTSRIERSEMRRAIWLTSKEGFIMRWQTFIGGVVVWALPSLAVQAVGNNVLHLPPYDFLMGNHIDPHMENKLQNDGSLKGPEALSTMRNVASTTLTAWSGGTSGPCWLRQCLFHTAV